MDWQLQPTQRYNYKPEQPVGRRQRTPPSARHDYNQQQNNNSNRELPQTRHRHEVKVYLTNNSTEIASQAQTLIQSRREPVTLIPTVQRHTIESKEQEPHQSTASKNYNASLYTSSRSRFHTDKYDFEKVKYKQNVDDSPWQQENRYLSKNVTSDPVLPPSRSRRQHSPLTSREFYLPAQQHRFSSHQQQPTRVRHISEKSSTWRLKSDVYSSDDDAGDNCTFTPRSYQQQRGLQVEDDVDHISRKKARVREIEEYVSEVDRRAQERQHHYPYSKPSDVHIIVDNSNVFIAAQHLFSISTSKNGLPSQSQQDAGIRINIGNLVTVIEQGRRPSDIRTRLVGGSTPPKTARVWTEWETCGYRCLLGDRSHHDKEVFLDDMLHAQILTIVTDHEDNVNDAANSSRRLQTLILVSGDGNSNDNRTSFPTVVLKALKRKWLVEIWSWKASLSSKFNEIQNLFPEQLTINYL
ncbi:unnamed protein product, partial [Didymodactylos carnosus]